MRWNEMNKYKEISEYRHAISEAIKTQYGSEVNYCEFSGIPYSSLRKFMRGEKEELTKRNMRLIEIDLGVGFVTPEEAMFELKNGGVGINLNTNSKANHLIADFDWGRLYKIARANKDKGTSKCLVKLNTAIDQMEFGCAATLYLNVKEEA